ncbi:hypothetical protein LTR95_000961 [Oleoguttula sp. CCFEE 5521]
MWVTNCVCQRFFEVGKWQRYFEVVADRAGQRNGTSQQGQHKFFRAQEEDLKVAESDAADEANRVQGFDDHRSTVVPWLRETGIVDHLRRLKKDEIRASFAVPPKDDGGSLRKIVDINETLLRTAHRSCFDGPNGMLTWFCRVVLSRFQSSQVETMGSTLQSRSTSEANDSPPSDTLSGLIPADRVPSGYEIASESHDPRKH